jgi:GMP synthase-like glutamine amidotransferase
MMLIVDMNREKDGLSRPEFVEAVASAAGQSTVRHYSEAFDSRRYDGIILSGAPLIDDEYMRHLGKFDWLMDCKKPVLGVCAGMQAIAGVWGSKLTPCQEIGMAEIETMKENPLFSGKFKAYELHNWAVKPTADFEVLARSEKCIQAIKHKEKPIYGVLFHPEVRNREIIERFAKMK